MRSRCSVYIATSLDGLIARPDGGLDWLSIVEKKGEDYGYARFMASIDALVIGRKTYETALGLGGWPYAAKRCIVLTHQSFCPKHGEELHSGSLEALVDKLGAEGVKRVYVDGGNVIRQFFAKGLVDDVTISIIPILLGAGVSLFGEMGREARLELVETRSFDTGLVQVEYRVKKGS